MEEEISIKSIEKNLRPDYYKKQIKLDTKYVGLPPQAYFNFLKYIDVIDIIYLITITLIQDDYLTEWEVMKFRTVFKSVFFTSFVIPVSTFAVFWLAFPRMFGFIAFRSQFYRSLRLACTLTNMGCVYALVNSFPFPNKQLHQIITQPEPNGQYVRKVMRVIYK